MRTFAIILSAALLAACGARTGYSVDMSAPLAATADETLACVGFQLDEMGYDVPPADQLAGTIEGEKLGQRGWPARLLGARPVTDRITAVVSDGQLQVSAASAEADADPATDGASESVRQDAEQIIQECS